MRFNLAEGFPLLTTKKLHMKSIIYELLFFMQGRTSNTWLNKRGVSIWDEWQKEDGDLGPIYGWQWRGFNATHPVAKRFDDQGRAVPDEVHDGVDQLKQCLYTLRTNPNDRRMIVSAWNPQQIDDMALPPCHLLYQFYVAEGRLSCQMYQRSCDFFLGVPFNIASYALLTMIMARMAGLGYGDFIWTGGDTHLYNNHIEQAKLQLTRTPKTLPIMDVYYREQGIDDWEYKDFELTQYEPYPHIRAEVSV